MKEKKEFQKPDVEVIEFDKKDDIQTAFSTVTGGGESMGEE